MEYYLGIDIGSTTVKLVLVDSSEQLLYKSYRRHFSRTSEIVLEELEKIMSKYSNIDVHVAMTGSGGLDLSTKAGIPFVQEVFATGSYVEKFYPDTDAAIELGGEDAKIIFFGASTDERMNGTCAGGTGAFIDQMASLINVSLDEMDELSQTTDVSYPIASRCGVFAKSDIQPLINQGASKASIARSVYRAVADQTIGGLAGGHPIKGNVLFLGGPLTFTKGLREAFTDALPDINPILPEDTEFFVAFGAAYFAHSDGKTLILRELISNIHRASEMKGDQNTLAPLFTSHAEWQEFSKAHENSAELFETDKSSSRIAYIGVDSGSTTTKLVAINENCRIIFQVYSANMGSPLDTVRQELLEFHAQFPSIKVAGVTVTGYGEELMKSAFSLDHGVVETVAHYRAARFFKNDVDFIIDIGGQDMKCFSVSEDGIDDITLNEACSSGCGSFLETFAKSMGLSIEQFSHLALFAEHPADLGSRCTVFMNSSVKQAQKNGASLADIAAGLSISVVKNALFKVLRVRSAEDLGRNVVVQGGTFQNDAVLRAFELMLGRSVIRPSIAGLMGAMGAALISHDMFKDGESSISWPLVEEFRHESRHTKCSGCQNHCDLTINIFPNGRRYISGARCSKGEGKGNNEVLPNLYRWKKEALSKYFDMKADGPVIGIPMVLYFYDLLPFFATALHEMGFSVSVSGFSTRNLYRKGQMTIPSDTICYGAKIAHGHVMLLAEKKVDAIFYPMTSYNIDEHMADNHYMCPVVAYYPEVLKANVEALADTRFLTPFLDFSHEGNLARQLLEALSPLKGDLNLHRVSAALEKGRQAQDSYRKALSDERVKAFEFARSQGRKIVVLAGRPYHVDPELNHGIDELLSSLGFVVVTEDSFPLSKKRERHVLNQWTYHNRMYNAAEAIKDEPDTELVQLISFGCGLDAVTSDEVKEILKGEGKLYTSLKIDEINNLGAARIRLRSLAAAMDERKRKQNG